MSGADAIDYFHSRQTPVALAALSIFGGADRGLAREKILKGQSRNGSWNDSLIETVRRIRLLTMLDFDISDPHMAEALEWVLWQQGMKDSYRGVFPSPTNKDMKGPYALPTGERLSSLVSFSHVYGELALRILIDAGMSKDPRVTAMLAAFETMAGNSRNGIYCCKNCTGAFWQVAARFPRYRMYAAEGLKTLKCYRTPEGRWRGFPFYFVLETLGSVKGMLALEEFEFSMKRLARSQNRDGSWGRTSKDEKTFAVLSGLHSLGAGEV